MSALAKAGGSLVAVCLAGGCSELSDKCALGASRCESGVVRVCEVHRSKLADTNDWATHDVCQDPSLCIESTEGGAFCVLSTTKTPACSRQDGPLCEGAVLEACRQGWVTTRQDCAASGASCEPGPPPSCLVPPDPNAICAGRTSDICDRSGLIRCESGRIESRTLCSAGCRIVNSAPTGFDGGASGFNYLGICGNAIAEVCTTSADCTSGLVCHFGACTVTCKPNDAGTDPCTALLTDSGAAHLVDTTVPIHLGTCQSDGFCAWGT